jgi:hypothetical protein
MFSAFNHEMEVDAPIINFNKPFFDIATLVIMSYEEGVKNLCLGGRILRVCVLSNGLFLRKAYCEYPLGSHLGKCCSGT